MFERLAGSDGASVTGLDVGSASVKAVRLRHHRGSAELAGLALVELPERTGEPDPAAEKAATVGAIRSALTKCGAFPGRNPMIVSAVGGPSVSVKHVRFPSMPEEALAESIRWEARKHVPFAQSEFVLDFQLTNGVVGGEDGGMQVLLTAAERALIDDHVALLKEAGVEPDTVDLIPLALLNEVEEEGLMDSAAVAVVDLGVSTMHVCIYRKGGLLFARSVPVVPGATAKWKDFVVKELHRSLTFYDNETGKQGIDKLYVSGGKALAPGIVETFQNDLRIAADVLDPLATLACPGVIGAMASQGPRFALAMGLARRA